MQSMPHGKHALLPCYSPHMHTDKSHPLSQLVLKHPESHVGRQVCLTAQLGSNSVARACLEVQSVAYSPEVDTDIFGNAKEPVRKPDSP